MICLIFGTINHERALRKMNSAGSALSENCAVYVFLHPRKTRTCGLVPQWRDRVSLWVSVEATEDATHGLDHGESVEGLDEVEGSF